MTTIEVLGIDNVLLAVGDVEEARRFYGEILGLPVKFDFAQRGILGFRLGEEEPGLVVREMGTVASAGPRETPKVWLEVPDIGPVVGALRELGIEPLGPPAELPTGDCVEIADPWGNVIGFTDYTRAPEMARVREGRPG